LYLIDLELKTITGQEVVKHLDATLTNLWVADAHQQVVFDLLEDLHPAFILDAVREL
jgi:hypothetical protein